MGAERRDTGNIQPRGTDQRIFVRAPNTITGSIRYGKAVLAQPALHQATAGCGSVSTSAQLLRSRRVAVAARGKWAGCERDAACWLSCGVARRTSTPSGRGGGVRGLAASDAT